MNRILTKYGNYKGPRKKKKEIPRKWGLEKFMKRYINRKMTLPIVVWEVILKITKC
jgi:hypothetical protein